MTGTILRAACLAVVLAFPQVVQAQGAAPAPLAHAGPYAEHLAAPSRAAAISRGRQMVSDFMAKRGVPGLSVAVSVDGRLAWSEGFGLADVEQGVPVTTATRFRSGSTAKPMSMAAAAVLHEQGKLDFDAPVQALVPSFPVKSEKPITFRMLAGMIGGLRHYRIGTEDFFSPVRYDDVLQYLDTFKDEPLIAEPGTKFFYSSPGTNLQGAMTQAAGGRPFPDLVQALVFEPLGMAHTTPDRNEEIIPNRTRYYERTGGARTYRIRPTSWGPEGRPERGVLLNAPYTDNSNKFPSGGYMTTPEDLVKFGEAHLRPGFLRAATLRELFTEQKTADGRGTGYGMNWFLGKDAKGRPIRWHPGSSVGGNSMLILYPDQKLVIAVQTNLTDSNMDELPRALADLFLDGGAGR
ncbi:serine hydrolase domain-containing protein [Phenylobacterium sp.]|jgi:serine beta-lactamase-like protein LACTB|uniref:serine hydrolase domain-containing protein n=1 Tax=Phenylobacterium sp. TaxID=1871053 RepID=UPI003782EB93